MHLPVEYKSLWKMLLAGVLQSNCSENSEKKHYDQVPFQKRTTRMFSFENSQVLRKNVLKNTFKLFLFSANKNDFTDLKWLLLSFLVV